MTLGIPHRPVTSLHFTISPGRQVRRLSELSDRDLVEVFAEYRSLAADLRRIHACTGFNLLVNDGRYGEQSVGEVPDETPAVRFHVFGRRADETLAPTMILNDPATFSLDEVSHAERSARLAHLRSSDEAEAAAIDVGVTDSGGPADPGDVVGADCNLCAVAEQEILRTDLARVIRPLRPIVPANVMLSPVRHARHLTDLRDDEVVAMFRLYDRVVTTFGQIHRSTSFNLFGNDGKVAGQHVPHVHLHLFGRSRDEETNPYDLLRGLRYRVVRRPDQG